MSTGTAKGGRASKKNAKRAVARAKRKAKAKKDVDEGENRSEEKPARTGKNREKSGSSVGEDSSAYSSEWQYYSGDAYMTQPNAGEGEEEFDPSLMSRADVKRERQRIRRELRALDRRRRQINEIKISQSRGIKLYQEDLQKLAAEEDVLSEIYELEELLQSMTIFLDQPSNADEGMPASTYAQVAASGVDSEGYGNQAPYMANGIMYVPCAAFYQNYDMPYSSSHDSTNEVRDTIARPLPPPRNLPKRCALTLRDPNTGEDITEKVFGRASKSAPSSPSKKKAKSPVVNRKEFDGNLSWADRAELEASGEWTDDFLETLSSDFPQLIVTNPTPNPSREVSISEDEQEESSKEKAETTDKVLSRENIPNGIEELAVNGDATTSQNDKVVSSNSGISLPQGELSSELSQNGVELANCETIDQSNGELQEKSIKMVSSQDTDNSSCSSLKDKRIFINGDL